MTTPRESIRTLTMTQDIIKLARKRLDYHTKEANRLADFIQTAEALEREVYADQERVEPERLKMPVSIARDIGRRLRESSTTKDILAAAEKVLRENGGPMLAADIYLLILEQGLHIGGQNPKGNLTAKFSTQKDTFVLDKDTRLWSLKQWQVSESHKEGSEIKSVTNFDDL